jgi:aminopeptidase N
VGDSGEIFPLAYYVFNENMASAQAGVARLPAAMRLFSNLFGPYPFQAEKYGMTQIGFYGGIENQTNTIINNMSPEWFIVAVHELAHMWFGDMITCVDWHHGWLNEGFATYCEALWTEHTGGVEAYKNYMARLEYFEGGSLYLQNVSDPFEIFIGIIYRKGAYTLHMLRGVLGDSLFFKSLYQYSQQFDLRYAHATTADFKAVCESVSGLNLDFFFEQWFFDELYPIYQYDYTQDPTTLKTTVLIKQIQRENGWRPVFEMPIQLKFNFIGGQDTLITVWNNEESQAFTFDFADHPIGMALDPDKWILRREEYAENILPDASYEFYLHQNHPNPFNLLTTIRFDLRKTSEVTITIYNTLGEAVRTLVEKKVLTAGSRYIRWDGRNNSGNEVATGLYFYQMKTAGFIKTKKMLLLQ